MGEETWTPDELGGMFLSCSGWDFRGYKQPEGMADSKPVLLGWDMTGHTPNRPKQSIQRGGLRGQDQGYESAVETDRKAWEAREGVKPCPVFLAFLMVPPVCKGLQVREGSQESIWNPGNRGS